MRRAAIHDDRLRGAHEEPGDLAVGVQHDPADPVRAVERDRDVDAGVAVADRDNRGAERLDLAGFAADLLADVGQKLDRAGVQHPLAKARARVVEAAVEKRLQHRHGMLDGALHRRNDPLLLGGGAPAAAEALERGLTTDAEQIPDLGPRVPGRARLLDKRAQGVLDDHVQAPRRGDRAHHLARGVLLRAEHVGNQLRIGREHHRHHLTVELRRGASFVHGVKVAFTDELVKTTFTPRRHEARRFRRADSCSSRAATVSRPEGHAQSPHGAPTSSREFERRAQTNAPAIPRAPRSRALDFGPQSMLALNCKANGEQSMQGTHDIDETTTADDGDGLDPREAARLLAETKRDAKREFNLSPPWITAFRAS